MSDRKMLQFRYSTSLLIACLMFTCGQTFADDADNIQDYGTMDSEGFHTTRISPAEKLLMTLARSGRVADGVIHGIKDGVGDFLTHIPLVNKVKDVVSQGEGRAKQSAAQLLNKVKSGFQAIYPGTKWCGDGDIAENDEDLGLFKKTDACCRAHDKCPLNLGANERTVGLWNTGIFTRSHCQCDTEFYNCLKDVHGVLATKIGTTYFNILTPQCFKQDYPITDCKEWKRHLVHGSKCEEYVQNYDASREWQWFDNPDFIF